MFIVARKVSRAELIRQAVAGFLAENRAGLEDSFGIWKKRGVDGVKYQDNLRGEWDVPAAGPISIADRGPHEPGGRGAA